ncbi:MAG: hypothetical protein ACR2NK_19380 [Mariniblastus sp.]
MLKYYFRALLLFGSVILFFAFLGCLIPRSYSFTSELAIAGKPEAIFAQLNSLENWTNWSRQFNPAEITDLKMKFNEQKSGKDAALSWTDIRGKGKIWITKSTPNQRIEYSTDFEKRPRMYSSFELVENENSTTVLWSSNGKLPWGPFYGYFGWLFPSHMKTEYSMSLEKLKQVIEAEHPSSPEALGTVDHNLGLSLPLGT